MKNFEKILDDKKIKKILKRISYQILEGNLDESEIFLVGIKKNGFEIAKLIKIELEKICDINIQIYPLVIDKKDLNKKILTEIDLKKMNNKTAILVDDVLNTGKTLIHAVKYILNSQLLKLVTVVLIDRNHKKFPIKVDIKGTSISTSINERIKLLIQKNKISAIFD